MQRTIRVMVFWIVFLPLAASGADRLGRWRAVWRVSQVLLAGADTADAASSWGKNEANPLVRAGPRFSYGSLAIKAGALGAGLAVQHYIVRIAPGQTPLLVSANLATACALGLAAAHNAQVPAPK